MMDKKNYILPQIWVIVAEDELMSSMSVTEEVIEDTERVLSRDDLLLWDEAED